MQEESQLYECAPMGTQFCKKTRAIKQQPLLRLLLSVLLLVKGVHSLCEIETGENVAIVEIPESWGSQTNQSTSPEELPIKGSEDEISISIQSETHRYFRIKEKRLLLVRPLDRDEQALTSIYLQVACTDTTTSFKRSIPVLVKVVDLNDNAPKFLSTQYSTEISELAPVGTVVYRDLVAKDEDSGSNGLIEYATVPGDRGPSDGYDYFEIKMPHQGLVTIKKPLDYERATVYYLNIRATDKAADASKRFTASTVLTVRVIDDDDLDPAFVAKGCTLVSGVCVNPEYKAAISSGSILLPQPIMAYDRDSINASIRYSFVNGTPSSYRRLFHIDRITGVVKQLHPIDRSMAKSFQLIVKAEEETAIKRFSTAKLTVDVLPIDKNPPVLTPSSYHGYVNENSPVGTTVSGDRTGKEPLRISVNDPDIASDDTPAQYAFEATTNAFRVNAQGFLLVNEPSLDRDPPNPSTYTFQVIARQIGSPAGKGASAPITLNVHLNDVNDNPPKLPNFAPVHVQAGDGIRPVVKVFARDADEVDKGKVVYSIYHVSNNGKEKFRIDSETGQIESVSRLLAGEQYSLTIQASDSRSMRSQSILDVLVVPGPNAGGPTFAKVIYEIEVSEGISPYSAVATLKATDPENDHIVYSIVGGNVNDDFIIGQHTGILTVAKRLDREEVSSYNLLIKAQDRGSLFGTATVSIIVTDINDENPQFLQEKYLFRVDEGIQRAFVGKVSARDADIGENGEVLYALSDSRYFQIDQHSGEIFTRAALDYEKQKMHRLVVTAQDRAPNSRLSTASVTVEVLDAQDELPYFDKLVYNAVVIENAGNVEVARVEAVDPDSSPSITYVIRDGDTSLFSVDPLTGIVKTIRGLDYEKRSQYTLIIGTMENDLNDPRATCVLQITVQDQNDNPPIFSNIPLPIRLQDSVPLGTVVTTLMAVDADSTSPSNQLRYEIAGKNKAPQYFFIDTNNGVISVKDDLRKEPESEYRIMVKAKDLGSPSLTSTAVLTVFAKHIATVPPDSGLGFADGRYTVEVDENVLPNTLVKTISVINKPRGNFPMSCDVVSGNEAGAFYVVENDQRDCEIRVKHLIDFEKQSKYVLTIRLNAIGGVTGVSRLHTQVSINVQDKNDHKPQFIIPQRYAALTGNRYLAAVSNDAPTDSQIIQLMASDNDSLSNSAITYELLPQSDPEGRFKIDPYTGILRTSRPMEDIPQSQMPLKVTVVARDNPELLTSSLSQSVEVVINLIENRHRMALVLKDTSTGRVQEMKENILQIIQERTGLLAGWEKAESLKLQRNNTIESDVTGTDIWFYLVEPVTLKIVDSTDLRIKSSIFDKRAQSSLLDTVSKSMILQADRIRQPYIAMVKHVPNMIPVPITTDVNDLGAALIVLVAIIAIFGVIGIICQCSMWSSRYNRKRERMQRFRVPTPSRFYDPIYVKPSLKEYETQVLQMSMPIDDDGSFDGKLPTRSLASRIHYAPGQRDKNSSPVHSSSNSLSANSTTVLKKSPTSDRGQQRRRVVGHVMSDPNHDQIHSQLYSEPIDSDVKDSSRILSSIGKTTEL